MGLKKSQIDKTRKSLSKKNLKDFNISYNGQVFKYDEIAFLVIDVQKEFCDPKHPEKRGNRLTADISKRIQSIAPEFRKASIPIYAIYFAYDEIKDPSEIDFYKFKPESGDTLVRKDRDSAFKGSNIKQILEKDKKKLLITCGFNLNACVEKTVLDAKKHGFEVCLLRDLSGNGKADTITGRWPNSFNFTKKNSIHLDNSEKVLSFLCEEAKKAGFDHKTASNDNKAIAPVRATTKKEKKRLGFFPFK